MGYKSKPCPSRVRKRRRKGQQDLRSYPLMKRHQDKLLRLKREKTSTSGPSLDMTVTSSLTPGCHANLILTYDDCNEEDVTYEEEILATVQPRLQVRHTSELLETEDDNTTADAVDPAIALPRRMLLAALTSHNIPPLLAALLTSLTRTRRQQQQVLQQFANHPSQDDMTRGDFCILCKTIRTEVLDRAGILFHRFPRSNRPKTVDRWTEVLTHAGCLVPDRLPMTAALCSLHFDADQYTNKVVRSTGEHKPVLKKGSLPTLLLRNLPGDDMPTRRTYKRRHEVAAPRPPRPPRLAPIQPLVEVDSDDEPQLVMDIPLDEDENSNMSQQESHQWTPSVNNLPSTPHPQPAVNPMQECVQVAEYFNNPPQLERTSEVDPLSVCATTFSETSVDVQPQLPEPETYSNTLDTTEQDNQLSADIQIASYYSLNEDQGQHTQLTESNAADLDVIFLSQQDSSYAQHQNSSNMAQMPPVELKMEKFHLMDYEEKDMDIPELAKQYFHLSQNTLEANSTEMMKLKEALQARDDELNAVRRLNNRREVQITKLTNIYRNTKQENVRLKTEVERFSAPCDMPNCWCRNKRLHGPMRGPVTPRVSPYNGYPQYPSPALPSASSTRGSMENNYVIPRPTGHPYLRQSLNQSEFSSFQRPAISQSPSLFNAYNPVVSKNNTPLFTPNNQGYAEYLSNLQRSFNTPYKFPYPSNSGYQTPTTAQSVPSYQNPQNVVSSFNNISSIHNSNPSTVNHGFHTASGVQSPQNGFAPLNNTSSIHNSSTVNYGFQTPAQSPSTASGCGPIVSPNIPTQSGYINPASNDSTQNQAAFSPANSPNMGYINEAVSNAIKSNDNGSDSISNSAAVLPSQSEFSNNSDFSLNVQVNEFQNTQKVASQAEQNVQTSVSQQNPTWFPPAYQSSSNSWSM